MWDRRRLAELALATCCKRTVPTKAADWPESLEWNVTNPRVVLCAQVKKTNIKGLASGMCWKELPSNFRRCFHPDAAPMKQSRSIRCQWHERGYLRSVGTCGEPVEKRVLYWRASHAQSAVRDSIDDIKGFIITYYYFIHIC